MSRRVSVTKNLILLVTILLTGCGTQDNINNTTVSADLFGQQNISSTEEFIKENIESEEENTMEITTTLDPNKPIIVLTFDDGPNLDITPRVLDILEKHEITASFFLIGNNININNMKVVKRAYDMGCEINNHSQNHSYMNNMTAEEIKKEVETTSKMVENIIGEPFYMIPVEIPKPWKLWIP